MSENVNKICEKAKNLDCGIAHFTLVCVTDQDTWTYSNLCWLCKSLAPEILSWRLRGIPAPPATPGNSRTFGAQARAFSSFVGLSLRIEFLTKTTTYFTS